VEQDGSDDDIETSFANTTSPTSTGISNAVTSNCYFVIQDTVSEYWWEEYSTEAPQYFVVNLTSITTLVTPYVDTTITETNVYTTNTTVTVTDQVGYNPASLMVNDGPQPFEATSSIADSTQIITAGATVQSPVAFWIYSSVKVITVFAVTDSNGNPVCQTTSYGTSTIVSTIDATTETFIDGTSIKTTTQYATTGTISYSPFVENSGGSSTSNIYIISGINSNAEAYFGGYNISGAGDLTIGPITGYSTEFADTVTLTEPRDATTVKYPATTRALGPNTEI
jgi:hypothetical protein